MAYTPIAAQPMGNILQTSYGRQGAKAPKPSRLAKLKKSGPPPYKQVAG